MFSKIGKSNSEISQDYKLLIERILERIRGFNPCLYHLFTVLTWAN